MRALCDIYLLRFFANVSCGKLEVGRFKTILSGRLVQNALFTIITGTLIWFGGWILYDVARAWRWFKPSLYQNLLLAILAVYVSGLAYRYWKQRDPFERLHRLVRQHVRREISKDVFEKRYLELWAGSDPDTRARMEEYLQHIISFEKAILYAEERLAIKHARAQEGNDIVQS